MADKETGTPPNPAEGSEPAPNADINAILRAGFGTAITVGDGTAEGAAALDMNARLRAAFGKGVNNGAG